MPVAVELTADRPLRRCGIVGFGHIGRIYYSILTACGSLRLRPTAIADTRAEVRSPADISRYADLATMLADGAIDVVVIATPPADHFALAVAALEAGKDVLVEKPPARTAAQAQDILTIARERHQVLFFAFHARHNPAVQYLLDTVDTHDVRAVEILYRESGLRFHPPDSWAFSEGALRESGINAVSIVTALVAERPITVTRAGAVVVSGRPAETKAHVECRFTGGTASLDVDTEYAGPEERIVTVRTRNGTYSADISRGAVLREGRAVFSAGASTDMMRLEYERMLAAFSDALLCRRSVAHVEEVAIIEHARQVAGCA